MSPYENSIVVFFISTHVPSEGLTADQRINHGTIFLKSRVSDLLGARTSVTLLFLLLGDARTLQRTFD